MGPGLHDHVTRGELDDATAVLTDALAFGTGAEQTELILPPLWGLAEVALQAGDPKGAPDLCLDALARAVAVDERVLLTPFVVTGVRAAQGAGRPAEAASWLEACVAQLDPIRDVAGAALDHGRGLVALADGSTGSRASPSRLPSTAGTGMGGSGRPLGRVSTWPIA